MSGAVPQPVQRKAVWLLRLVAAALQRWLSGCDLRSLSCVYTAGLLRRRVFQQATRSPGNFNIQRTGQLPVLCSDYSGTGQLAIQLSGYSGTGQLAIQLSGYSGTGQIAIQPSGYSGTGQITIQPSGYTVQNRAT